MQVEGVHRPARAEISASAIAHNVRALKAVVGESLFCAVVKANGYGHGAEFWKALVSALRVVGYDHVLSIEHEDSLMSADEGLRKAIEFLRRTVIREKPGLAYWAG